MKRLGILATMAAVAVAAQAQVVPGNEALRLLSAGRSRVQTPPLPRHGPIPKPCAVDAGCHAGPWFMVETPQGLLECTEAYARPGTCRPSSHGTRRLLRLWIVLAKGRWLQCQRPDLASHCVDMFARPPANLGDAAIQ